MSKPLVESRLRLFLSVDIVGSTSFKQRRLARDHDARDDNIDRGWVAMMKEFYLNFPALFQRNWKNVSKRDASFDEGDPPRLWKAVGDELLFTKKLTNHLQAVACVDSFLDAVGEHRGDLQQHDSGLSLKAAAWLAGFPINNAEIAFDPSEPQTPREVYSDADANPNDGRDYIGPYIDIGFRLADFATRRKAVLSIDLLFLLLAGKEEHYCSLLEGKHDLYYDGGVNLEGVVRASPYPLFWLDMMKRDELTRREKAVRGDRPCDFAQVKAYAESYLDSPTNIISRPYIIGDEILDCPPDDHKDQLRVLEERLQKEEERESYTPAEEGATPEEEETRGDLPDSSKQFKEEKLRDLQRDKSAKQDNSGS